MEKIIEIRQQYRLKLPDTVIAAMAIQNSAIFAPDFLQDFAFFGGEF